MKKFFAYVLALCMVLGMLPAAAAAGYEDTDGHWAEEAIERWTEYGIVEGNNGLFDPNGELTRGQLAALVARLLNLPEAESAGFGDTDGHWAEDFINRCAAVGIMQGDGINARPDDPITREETMVMLGRALGIQPVENADLSDYGDSNTVSDWAAGYVAAMTESGIVNGIDGNLAPNSDINRASTMTLLNRAITSYVNEPGQTVEATGTGIVLVAAADVTVTGQADGIVVTQAAAESTITLDNATVGTVIVQAEKSAVVMGENSTANSVDVTNQASGAAVQVTETAKVENVTAGAAESTVTVSGTVGTVTTTEQATGSAVQVTETAKVENVTAGAAESTVTVSGTVSNVTTTEQATGAAVQVTETAKVENVTAGAAESTVSVSGTVSNVTVNESAANTKVETEAGSTITNVDNKAENTTVTGSGTVENVTTSGNNTTVETEGTKVEAAVGTTGTTAGDKEVEGGESTTTKPATPTIPSTPPVYEHYCSYTAVVTEPTCTEQGYTTYTCRCGDSYKSDYVDATGHVNTAVRNCTTPAPMGCKETYCLACGTILETTYCELVYTEPTCTGKGIASCKVCGIEYPGFDKPELGHTEVVDEAMAPTCTETGLTEGKHCSVCDEVLTAQEVVPELGHTWGEPELKKNETCGEYKLYTCTVEECGATKTEALETEDHDYSAVVTDPTCTEGGYTTYTCDDCGHSYTGDTVDAKGHTEVVDAAKAPTCTATGLTEGKHCSVCDEVLTAQEVVPALGHKDENPKNYICDVCETDLCTEHTEETVPGKAATCTATGLTDGKKCSICGEILVEQEVVPELGHSWDAGEVTTPATCSAKGVKTFACTVDGCNATKTEDVAIDANAHKWGEYTSNNDATCKEDGTKTAECANGCGEKKTVTDEDSAKGHSWDAGEVTTPATCSAEGVKTFTCTTDKCGATKAEKVAVDANAHKWGEYKSNNDATCEEDGTKTATCDRDGCDETDTVADEGSKLGHSFTNYVSDGNATCEEDGTKTAECANGCGEKKTVTDEDSAKGHSWDAGEVTTPATCSAEGVKTFTCTTDKCGATKTEEVAIDANAHKWGEYKSNNDATCEKDGTKTAKCDNGCGKSDTKTDEGSALGHKDDDKDTKCDDCEGSLLPVANVVRSPEYENQDLDWGNYGAWSPTAGLDSQLEAAYTFTCKETPEEAEKNFYANWHCDFYVMLNKDLGANEVFLGGYYESFNAWVGFHNGDLALEAGTEIPLLGSVGGEWTYLDVVQNVGEFICGVGDVDDALVGATFTVMLRLTNPENENEFYNVATINYTFTGAEATDAQ